MVSVPGNRMSLVIGKRLGPGLAGTFDHVFVGRQLCRADRSARVHPTCRNPNLCAHAELAAIGELG